MNYISTRGKSPAVSAATAIKNGIADDGGLYIPETIPAITESDIGKLCKMNYAQRAAYILSLYLSDYTYDELLEDCTAAYGEKFNNSPAPIVTLKDEVNVLELWHGPTCAFKDMALQIMPRLMSRALSKTGEKRKALILTATSGDTGKAALEGYCNIDKIDICVFYPVNGVSNMQKRQMATQEGSNVDVTSIYGNFDDAQTGVKTLFADKELAASLSAKGYFLSSANSINWGRLAPQIVYYVSAWCDLRNSGIISDGECIDVCVPTGNFGNILAAYTAKLMGLPISKLVCASNTNNVLTDFIQSGTYNKNRKFVTTISPSMDILVSSNLERLLCLTGGNEKCADYMSKLSENGRYTVTDEIISVIRNDFKGYYCTESDCEDTIKSEFAENSYLCDPHTAVALFCAGEYAKKSNSSAKMLVVSTASPYKFAPAVSEALGITQGESDEKTINNLSDYTSTDVPKPLAELFCKKIRFSKTIEASDMKQSLIDFIDSLA